MIPILAASTLPEVCKSIAQSLQQQKVDTTHNYEECLQLCRNKKYDICFIDLFLLKTPVDKDKSLQNFWKIFPGIQIIVLCSQQRVREAVELVRSGVCSDYLAYPIEAKELQYVVESTYKSLRMRQELDYLRDKFWKDDSLELIRTNSVEMQKVFEKVRAVAPTKTTVLLTGETGTGKGVLARLLHHHSNRSEKPFISVHCGAIPDSLLESELFGHEKGSFTGALRKKLGKFELSQGGTIFLDEIGTITTSAQIKLLQVLQDKIFQRVGGECDITADVRIIAATNENLKSMVDQGTFRRDLFYRLSVFPIEVSPLRQRIEDIPLLANIFLRKLNMFHGKEIKGIHPHVMESFNYYPWPGNIREFENLMERAYILESSDTLTPESFPCELFSDDTPSAPVPVDVSMTLAETRRRTLEQIERHYLKEVLAQHHGRINKTAIAAGISSRQLHKLLTKYGIRKEDYKYLSGQVKNKEK